MPGATNSTTLVAPPPGAMAHYSMLDERTQEELSGWLRLALEPGLGRATGRQLLGALGLPHHALAAGPAALARHLPSDLAGRLAAPPQADVQAGIERALHLLAQPGHCLITLADPHYPRSLFDSPDPPLMLFVRGDPQWLRRPAVAIVGARNATGGGCDNARAFARYLAGKGWAVVSGLARGIDAAAHEGALLAGPDGGGTIAVLPGGLDSIYPPSHAQLAEQIAAHGALVTEYPPGTPAQPFRFPDRNRLVAALARGVLVVEAAAQSGSLITARLALECGREVFAIPGSIHAPLARGCHALIRQGAKLVEQGSDIEEELLRTGPTPPAPSADRATASEIDVPGWLAAREDTGTASPAAPAARRPANRMLKDPTVLRVLDALGYEPAGADQLCRRSGLEFSRVATVLTELEMNDIVQRLDDGRYLRRQQGIIYG